MEITVVINNQKIILRQEEIDQKLNTYSKLINPQLWHKILVNNGCNHGARAP